MLARETVQELQDGDSLSFPGGRFVFEVHEKDGGVQLGLEAGAEDSAPSLPLSSFGARRRSGHSDDEASSGATAVQPAQETLRKLRTDILKEFESPSRRGSRDSTVADGNSASAARFTTVAAAHTAEQGGTELQGLLRQELARARADLAAERQLREEAERRLRTTERAVSRGRHQVIQGGASRTSSDGKEAAELRVALAATQARQQADAQQLFELQRLLKQKDAQVTDTKKLLMVEKQRLWAESDIRRKLHNDLQEIKGNIRVLARIRPIDSYSPKQRCVLLQELLLLLLLPLLLPPPPHGCVSFRVVYHRGSRKVRICLSSGSRSR
eukprot:COSAG03_NODE_2022_length_3207_cov_31.114543_2_plen_327_part_00